MKISFVTANLWSGGAERVISLLANHLSARGHEVEVLLLRDSLVFYELDKKVRVLVCGDECCSNAMWRKLLWMRKHIKKTRPDVLVPFRVSVYCTTIMSLLGVSVPIVASERIDPYIPDSYWTYLRKILLPFVNHLVVQTSYIKTYYPKFLQKRITVIANPVREECFMIHSSEIIEKQNRVVSVARLYEQKNQEMMIRAFAQVSDSYPDWKLVIFGEGPLRDSLQLIIDSLQLTDRILLPGRTNLVIDELRRSKVFCLTSEYEGMSNSMLEAFCVGLPIVSTKVSGTEELVIDGVNGFLVNMDDSKLLADCLSRLMGNEELLLSMSDYNLKYANNYSIEHITSLWENVLYKTIEC